MELALGLPPEDWRLMVACGGNLLIEGAEVLIQALVHALIPYLRHPVDSWHGGLLPARPATLVIRNVASLTTEEQNVLFRWLDVTGERRRVVSASSKSLFPLVERGLFREDLYYRLNVIRLLV